MRPVDLSDERELRRAGGRPAEHDAPGGGGEGAADAAGVVHDQPTTSFWRSFTGIRRESNAGWPRDPSEEITFSTSSSRSDRAAPAAERAAGAVGAAAITWPTRSRNEPVPPTRWPGRAAIATSTIPGTAAAAATPPVRWTLPACGATRKRIDACPGPGRGNGDVSPMAASTVAPTRS